MLDFGYLCSETSENTRSYLSQGIPNLPVTSETGHLRGILPDCGVASRSHRYHKKGDHTTPDQNPRMFMNIHWTSIKHIHWKHPQTPMKSCKIPWFPIKSTLNRMISQGLGGLLSCRTTEVSPDASRAQLLRTLVSKHFGVSAPASRFGASTPTWNCCEIRRTT